MDNDELFRRRYVAVRNALHNARSPEFKELWKNIMTGLIEAEVKKDEINNDTI